MKPIQATPATIEIQAAQSGEENALPRFKMTAYTGGLMRLYGWDYPVGIEVSGMAIDQKTPIRAEHEKFYPVGHTEKITSSASGIEAEGLISRDNDISRDIVQSSKNGYPWQASVGASAENYRLVKEGESASLNGSDTPGPFYHVLKSRLNEISFVERGADPNTLAVAANKPENKTMSEQPNTPEQEKPVAASAPAAPPVTASKGDELAVIRAAREEETRKQTITGFAERALQAGADIDQVEALLKNALANKQVNASQFEHDMLLIERRGPNIIAKRDAKPTGKMVEAALAMNAGVSNLEKQYDEQTLNAAQDNFSRGLSLTEALTIYASQNGFRGTSRDVHGLLEAAFSAPRGIAASSFSTNSLPGIFSNLANKMLRVAFESVEDAWQSIASVTSVRDFKKHTAYSLTGDLTFAEVAPGGEITHGKLGETVYENQAKTYARMLSLTRQDIINDDLGALNRAAVRIGRGAALRLNQVFWAAFLDDAAFFNTDKSKKNYVDGSASNLSSAGLELANTAFQRQTDPDGNPLGLRPRILLTPVELGNTARELMNSQLIVSGSTGKNPNTNIWQGRYTPVETVYLTAAKVWYLLADPMDMSTIEVAFLNGQRLPTVETAQADFNVLGIAMRGFFDFGVAKQEYRAAVKVKGEA